MSHKHAITLTDTFGGEPNYGWARRHVVTMPELTHYGYDGFSNYGKANKVYNRELMRKAKAAVGLTGFRGRTHWHGEEGEFRPYGLGVVLLLAYVEAEDHEA